MMLNTINSGFRQRVTFNCGLFDLFLVNRSKNSDYTHYITLHDIFLTISICNFPSAALPAIALSQCSCGNTTFDAPSPIVTQQLFNPKDLVTGAACAMNCTYFFTYSGPTLRSLYAFFVYFTPATDNVECLSFYDGVGTNGTLLSPT
jgi:hypothetical protein